VRHHDRHGHQFGRLIAGISEHHPLVACAARVDAHGDVGRLRLNRVQDAAGFAIVAECGVRVANVLDNLARYFGDVDIGGGCDFSGHYTDAGCHKDFTGNAASRIVRENRVEN